MIPFRTKMMAIPILLAGAMATALLRQPGDQASAFSDGGSAVYSAQVLSPSAALPITKPAHRHAISTVSTHYVPLPDAPRRGFEVRGKPSVSAALIDRVLADYGSPMAGQGKALYDLGVKYGIDPAFCLAFFIHESAAGTRGEAILTHNLGNIRSVAGAPSLDGYRYYDTWLDGAEDWYRLISSLYVHDWKLTSVGQIIPVYAPTGDNNDPTAYIDDVEQLVTAWRAES